MNDQPNPEDAIFIANAGLVLLTPFLPQLFERLDLLTVDHEDRQGIIGTESLSRAVHLLQYMIDEQLDAPESELVLNKLLCGATSAHPVLPSITPDSAHLEICEGLLGAVVDSWPVISGTSLAGLRETFLQREGRLSLVEGGWRLQVQRKGVDGLVDQMPWSFKTIFHRWMAKPIQVTW